MRPPTRQSPTLSNPASIVTGTLTFTAPADTTLIKDTTYYVLFNGDNVFLRSTSSNNEDSSGLSDWSVENDRKLRDDGTTGPFTNNSSVTRIAVNGTVNGGTTPTTAGVTVSVIRADGDGGGHDRGHLHGGARQRADVECHGRGRRAREHGRVDRDPGQPDLHDVELEYGQDGDGDRRQRYEHRGRNGVSDPQRDQQRQRLRRHHDRRRDGGGGGQRHRKGDGGGAHAGRRGTRGGVDDRCPTPPATRCSGSRAGRATTTAGGRR